MTRKTIIYTSATCPVCSMAKDLLNSMNEPYKEINIDVNPLTVIQLVAKTKKFTVPQTIINGKVISGFKPEEVIQAMY